MSPRSLLLLWLALAPAWWAAGARTEDLAERIPVAPGGRLTLDLDLGLGLRPDRGTLEVLGHDLPEIHVDTESSGWASWGVVFQVARTGPDVRIVGRIEGATSWLFGGPRVAVRVRVPRPFALDLRTTAGPIRVDGTEGALRIRGADGDVEVTRASGSLKLRTLRGTLLVQDTLGDLDLKTAEGDIEISDARGAVRARTNQGDIEAARVDGAFSARSGEGEIELSALRGPVEARTGRGTLRIGFTGDPGGALETAEGGIDVSFPARAAADLDARGAQLEMASGVPFRGERDEGTAVGALGRGGPSLWLRAPHGRIRLSRREVPWP